MSLLQMSFSGAVLILVIAAVRMVSINRLPKKTFLILWSIVLLRLLIPYTAPSICSVYTLVSSKTPVCNTHTTNPTDTKNIITQTQNEILLPVEAIQQQEEEPVSLSVKKILTKVKWSAVWLVGMLLSTAFFIISYLHWRFEFQASLPIHNDFVEQWRKTHLLKRPIYIRQSDKISAPLTYGIIKPVILMPKKTDWENTAQLEYVLLHEYVHIRRYDSVTKLVAICALCLHWFNLFVWGMYILFQRDIELACDESVVRCFGESSKATYAHMLIDMEARKSGLMPLCNNFSKNAIEERIIAIMKMKKTSIITTLAAVVLVAGITTAFATTAEAQKAEYNNTNLSEKETDIQKNQDQHNYSNGTEEDYRSLLTLKTPDYQKMSVADFNMALLDWTNKNHERMEQIKLDTIYKDFAVNLTDDELSFVTMSVLFSEMENRAYIKSNDTGKPEVDPSYGQYLPEKTKQQDGQNIWCDLYYQFSYHIEDKKAITVEERDHCVSGMMAGILEYWNKTTLEDLQNMTKEDVIKALKTIAAAYSDDKITVMISEDQINFTYTDEPNMETENWYKTGVICVDAQTHSKIAPDDPELTEQLKVIIIEEQNGFYHVSGIEDDIDAWVRKEYVDIEGFIRKE